MTTPEAWLIGGVVGVGFIAVRAVASKVLVVHVHVRPHMLKSVKRAIGIVMLLLIVLARFTEPFEWERDLLICFGAWGYLLLAQHLIFGRPKESPAPADTEGPSPH